MKTVVTRITLAEYASLRKLLDDDELSVQSFLSACVQAYLRGDGPMSKVVTNYKRLSAAERQDNRGHLLSVRERRAMFDEIEREDDT